MNDCQAIHYLEFADQNWLAQQIELVFSDSKIKKFARVTTIESFSLVDMNRIFKLLRNGKLGKAGVEFEEFLDKQEALNWLLTNVDQSVVRV